MIQLNIIVSTEERASEVAKKLLKDKLAADISIATIDQCFLNNDKLHLEKRFRIISKTKALLFQEIDNWIKNVFNDEIPEIYSVPIVNIDWDQANTLINSVKKA